MFCRPTTRRRRRASAAGLPGGAVVPGPCGYNSSKAALNAVTLIYARSLAADGIRVNALSPGYVATDLNRHTGHLPAAQGGASIAEQILRDGTGTGQFLSETGGTHPW